MGFAHTRIISFSTTYFSIPSITIFNFFESVLDIMFIMIYLHHFHVTGRIVSYAHDFCNRKIRENYTYFTCMTHYFFGFDFSFVLKSTHLSVQKEKDFAISGTNLTNLNFADLGNQVRFIDTLKYYHQSHAQLANTITPDEKAAVKKLTEKFLRHHDYFITV